MAVAVAVAVTVAVAMYQMIQATTDLVPDSPERAVAVDEMIEAVGDLVANRGHVVQRRRMEAMAVAVAMAAVCMRLGMGGLPRE